MPHPSHWSRIVALAVVLVLLATPGLQARKKKSRTPEFLHSEFASLGIKDIYVLPVVDHRQNKDFNAKFQEPVVHAIGGKLDRKGYDAHLPEPQATSEVTEEQLAHPSPALVKSLAPPGSEWVLLPVLLRLERHTNIAAKGEAGVRLYLFQTQTGDLIWQDSGNATERLGVFLTFAVAHDALMAAAQDALSSFPANEKKR